MMFGEKGLRKLFKIINDNVDMPEIFFKFQMLIGRHFNVRRESIPIFADEELMRLAAMPVFLFVGEKDVLLNSAETAERMKKFVPNIDINILPEAGRSITSLTDTIFERLEE